MLKFPCLVLDHDDTVVQSEKTLGFPYFKEVLKRFRPHADVTYEEYVHGCHEMVFSDMCRQKWNTSGGRHISAPISLPPSPELVI